MATIIKWTEIGPQTTIPDIEVIGLNAETQEMMVGYITEIEQGVFICEDEFSTMEITHFMYSQELINLLEDE